MKTPILIAVKLKGKRGRKESFVQSGGETYASFETWPKKTKEVEESREERAAYADWVWNG